MKKMTALALATLTSVASAAELKTFEGIADHVNQGKKVTFVINFSACKSEMPVGAQTLSVTPNAVAVIDDSLITASDRHFTLDDPLERGMPLFDYGKFSISEDGSASVKLTIMNAVTYERLSSYTINCHLGEGFKVFN